MARHDEPADGVPQAMAMPGPVEPGIPQAFATDAPVVQGERVYLPPGATVATAVAVPTSEVPVAAVATAIPAVGTIIPPEAVRPIQADPVQIQAPRHDFGGHVYWRQQNLCDCTSKLCWKAYFCYCSFIPQLYVAIMHKHGQCRPLSVLLWMLFVAALCFALGSSAYASDHWFNNGVNGTVVYDHDRQRRLDLQGLSRISGFISSITICMLLMQARKRMRDLHAIPGTPGEDCCVSYWCWPCVALQLSRQLGWDSRQHSLCTEDGSVMPGA